MKGYLATIVEQATLDLRAGSSPAGRLQAALTGDGLSVIAEIKRRSPSKGVLARIENPIELARQYALGGADALSVLTNGPFFGGSLEDLRRVVGSSIGIPVVRKEFIIDPIQVAEAAVAEAAAVLLIVAVLGPELPRYMRLCETLGLDALIEVHSESEVEIALQAGARLIGINNRNLETFQVDLRVTQRLVRMLPAHVLAISESGVRTIDDAQFLYQTGVQAVLVGEAFVAAADPAALIRRMKQCCH